jgi:RNA polymerase sigma factor (sigma-70 family)
MAHMRSGGGLRNLRTLFGPGTATGLSDSRLLGRFASRKAEVTVAADAAEAAFASLVARHGPMVLGVCRRALTDPNDVEDAFQATFLVLVRRVNAIRVADSLAGWLHGVARRVAAKARTKSQRRRPPPVTRITEPSYSGFDPELAELHRALDEEIDRRPGKLRSPLVICHLQGLSHAEAASRLGWPIGTVSGRLSQARKLLRERLVRRGFSLAVGPLLAVLDPRAVTAAMPETLAGSTCRAALQLAIGGVSSTGPSAIAALDLAKVILMEMIMSKLKTAVAVSMVLSTIAIGAGAGAQSRGQDPLDLETNILAPVARREEPRATDHPILHFPADRAIGVLYTRPRDAKDWPGDDWEQLRGAIGEVDIPAGRQVRLQLSAGSREELTPLRRLKSDDLRSIHIRDADLRNDRLAPIAHLTALEELELLDCPIGDEGARHLAGLPRLKSLTIGGCQVGDEGLGRLTALRSLERLDLGNCWITEAGMVHVGRMKSLKSLSLYRSDIDDGGLAQLKELSALESLRLADCLHITGAGLAHLAGLSRLRSLDLESTPITDAGLAHLAGLANLEDLNLPDLKITDAGLAHLRGLRSLRRLSLPQGISDTGLAHVGAVRSLRELFIRPGRVTDRGIAPLSALDQLQALNISSGVEGSHVTDAAAVYLSKIPSLRKLGLGYTEIGDKGMEVLARAASLEWLRLYENKVTPDGLRHLAQFPALICVELSGIRGPGASLRHLQPLKNLTMLKVCSNGWLGLDGIGDRAGDQGLGYLSGLTRLESLTLDLPLTDESMRRLAGLTSLWRLEVENKNNRLTDDGLKYVSGMQALKYLRVSGWITYLGLRHLEGLRSLYRVNLGCQPGAISDEAAAWLKARNPAIQVMAYNSRRKGDPNPPAVAQNAPDVELETFDGKKLRLSELKGKVVLLHFWATWCTPCLKETPQVKAFIEARRDEDKSFEAVSLSFDEDAHWAKRHAQRNELSWPQAWVGANSPACLAYAVNSAPHYVVISRDGKVAYAGCKFDEATTAGNGALERSFPSDPLRAK